MATGPQLRVARVARGLTLFEAARRAGMGISTLSRLENGLAPLRPNVEARLKSVVGWNDAFELLFAALRLEDGEPASEPAPRKAKAQGPRPAEAPSARVASAPLGPAAGSPSGHG